MSEVYVVTDGMYSDYGIVACFSDREVAKAFVRENGGEVETYKLYDRIPRKKILYSKVLYAKVEQEPEGDCITLSESERSEAVWEWRYLFRHPGHSGATLKAQTSDDAVVQIVSGTLRRQRSVVTVQGFDKQAVDKAFHDRVAEVKARIEGVA